MQGLADAGADVQRLDVTDAASRSAVAQHVAQTYGRLDLLVNNAGYGPLGAVEDTDPDTWTRILQTNVVGVADLTRLVLPMMRRQQHGRVVTIGSMGGEFTTPLGGAYHASKYAVEALSDALRAEVRPFGIDVVLVQPGPVATPMAQSAADVALAPGSPYAAAAAHVSEATRRALASGRGVLGPGDVAAVVVQAARVRRPRARYKVGLVAHLVPLLRRRLPLRWWDRMVSRQAGLHLLGSGTATSGGGTLVDRPSSTRPAGPAGPGDPLRGGARRRST
jgi:NAD(P)-dependent dehydrogenase (short-subunit alcohol dehydrogenase family)